MKVDIFTLCDSAQEYNGKMVIVGTFNNIYAKEFPATHSGFALAARVVFDKDEKGIYDINLSVKKEGSENTYIIPESKMKADTTNTERKDTVINIILQGSNVSIPEEGTYIMSLRIGDKTWASKLTVEQR